MQQDYMVDYMEIYPLQRIIGIMKLAIAQMKNPYLVIDGRVNYKMLLNKTATTILSPYMQYGMNVDAGRIIGDWFNLLGNNQDYNMSVAPKCVIYKETCCKWKFWCKNDPIPYNACRNYLVNKVGGGSSTGEDVMKVFEGIIQGYL